MKLSMLLIIYGAKRCFRIQVQEVRHEASRNVWSKAGGLLMPCLRVGPADPRVQFEEKRSRG
jgi:hypothetical protein